MVSKKRVTLIALFGAVLAVPLCVAFQLTNSKASAVENDGELHYRLVSITETEDCYTERIAFEVCED